MKNSEQKKLDQVLKDKLSEGTAQVPDFVWDRIEEELFPKKKRRGFFWWFFSGLCMLLIGGLIAVAVSDQGVHSQNNTLPNASFNSNNCRKQNDEMSLVNEHKSTKTTIALASANKNESLRKGSFHTNFFKRKGGSSVSAYKHVTGTKKRPLSQVNNTNRVSKKQPAKLAAQKSSTSKRILPVDSEIPTSKKISVTPPLRRASTARDENKGGWLTHSKVENSNPSVSQNDSIKSSKPVTPTDPNPKSDKQPSHELSYEEILALVKKDFSKRPDELPENKRKSFLSLGIYGGPSLYNTATFKDYFTSGQLSNRTFASSGFELGLQARFKVSDRFKIYTGLAFNQKQTQFSYNIAITQADYFTYVVNGTKVPLENIHDDGMNSCFLANNVTARYQIQSVLISFGTSFEFLRIGKFSAAADLRLSGNIHSSLKLKEMQVLNIEQPQSEKFSYLQPGAGLLLNFRLNPRISFGLNPFFSKQFYLKKSFSRKMDELVIPFSMTFNF